MTRSQAKKRYKSAGNVSMKALKPFDDKKIRKQKSAIKISNTNKLQIKKKEKTKIPPAHFMKFMKFVKIGKRKSATKICKSDELQVNYKDPRFPRCPYRLFLEDYVESNMKTNPHLSHIDVVCAGRTKWMSMSKEEKAPYKTKADRDWAIYEKLRDEYRKHKGKHQLFEEEQLKYEDFEESD